jgi:hypothetical protein
MGMRARESAEVPVSAAPNMRALLGFLIGSARSKSGSLAKLAATLPASSFRARPISDPSELDYSPEWHNCCEARISALTQ